MEVTISKALVMRKRAFHKLRKLEEQEESLSFYLEGQTPPSMEQLGDNIAKKAEVTALITNISVQVQLANTAIAAKMIELDLEKRSLQSLNRIKYAMNRDQGVIYPNQTKKIWMVDSASIQKEIDEVEERIESLQDEIAVFNQSTKITI